MTLPVRFALTVVYLLPASRHPHLHSGNMVAAGRSV